MLVGDVEERLPELLLGRHDDSVEEPRLVEGRLKEKHSLECLGRQSDFPGRDVERGTTLMCHSPRG